MRNFSPSASWRHQLVLSLSPHSLCILHFYRGLLGWKRAHEHVVPLPEGEGFTSQLQQQLADSVTRWKIPAGTRAHWVLAGDILGIVPPNTQGAGAPPSLPFPASDTRTQVDGFGGAEGASLMWMHKDWVTEIERISSACRLALVELYARAQLFQRIAAKQPASLRAVVEADATDQYLHVYAANGTMLRTRVLEAHDGNEHLAQTLQVELAALGAPADAAPGHPVQLSTPRGYAAEPRTWAGYQHHVLPAASHADLLEKLWRSDQGGIVVRHTHNDMVQALKVLSLGLGAVGMAGLALMVWHDGRLVRQIEEGRERVRKDLPKVEAAKLLKARTLRMADAVQAVNTAREAPSALGPFSQLVAYFPPPPATLQYFSSDNGVVALAGQGNEGSVKWLQERPLAGFGAWTDFPVPEYLAASSPQIHLQARKEAPQPIAAPAPAQSPTSGASQP